METEKILEINNKICEFNNEFLEEYKELLKNIPYNIYGPNNESVMNPIHLETVLHTKEFKDYTEIIGTSEEISLQAILSSKMNGKGINTVTSCIPNYLLELDDDELLKHEVYGCRIMFTMKKFKPFMEKVTESYQTMLALDEEFNNL